jgi:hypothetical protein
VAAKLAKRHELIGSGPVSYRIIGQPEAPTGVYLAVDYTDAPVPDHFYVADYVYAANLDSDVLLVFGKGERSEIPHEKLRSKVEVFFPASYFVNQFWKTSRDFHGTLRKLVEDQHYRVHGVPSSDVYAEKVQTLHSNNALIVLSGGEALIDFFYISPRDLYLKPRRNLAVGLEALVRILLAPPLLLSLLDACVPIVDAMKQRLPMEETGNEIVESDSIL